MIRYTYMYVCKYVFFTLHIIAQCIHTVLIRFIQYHMHVYAREKLHPLKKLQLRLWTFHSSQAKLPRGYLSRVNFLGRHSADCRGNLSQANQSRTSIDKNRYIWQRCTRIGVSKPSGLQEVWQILVGLAAGWLGTSYHPLKRGSVAFGMELGGLKMPAGLDLSEFFQNHEWYVIVIRYLNVSWMLFAKIWGNCLNFCSEFSIALQLQDVPGWVGRLAVAAVTWSKVQIITWLQPSHQSEKKRWHECKLGVAVGCV